MLLCAAFAHRAVRERAERPPPHCQQKKDLERATAFDALLRFGSGDLRRRPLIGSPPALERLFIASLVG